MRFKSFIVAGVLAVVAASSFALGAAEVRVINRSSKAIFKIQTSPAYATRFGSTDLLADGTIPSGYNRVVDFDVPDAQDKCIQDIRLTFEDGSKFEKRLDVCQIVNWTIND